MPSVQPENRYTPYRAWLLGHARQAMEHGVRHGEPPPVSLDGLDALLTELRATFVTLHQRGNLRGCIGRLEAVRPLAIDLAMNAVAAALEDPRFPPVTAAELSTLHLELSILTPPEPMPVTGEADLLKRLQPGVDGLILGEGRRRATFLPSVWEELPDPHAFIAHLKQKAGWPPGYWSDTIQVQRYRTHSFSE
jgi:AmmeMemoRadiSam system protein A